MNVTEQTIDELAAATAAELDTLVRVTKAIPEYWKPLTTQDVDQWVAGVKSIFIESFRLQGNKAELASMLFDTQTAVEEARALLRPAA